MFDYLTQVLLELGLEGLFTYCGKGLVRAFKSLSEYCGNNKTPLFESVSEFWYDGVDNDNNNEKIDRVKEEDIIRIQGVVSLFIPLCPRHPKAIPGKQAKTWITLHNESAHNRTDIDFGTKDFALWNDGILVPPQNITNRKAVIGLSDKYGYVGHGCIPLVIDLSNKSHMELYRRLIDEQPVGFEAVIKGRVKPFTIDLARDFDIPFIVSEDIQLNDYPNYVIEVYEINVGNRHKVLTGTMWVGYEDNRIYPIYCHLLNKSEYRKASTALSAEFGKNSIIAVHDAEPYELIYRRKPILNEGLENMLNNS